LPSVEAGSVCAVVVTFNRKQLLMACLRSLLAQSRRPDKIIVVDNHSTDGTRDLLAAEFPDLTVLALDENGGGSKGFCEGAKWAFENGFEWIWLMDDDIEAFPGTLDRMLTFRDLSHFIHLRREDPSGKILSIEAIWDLSSCVPVQYGRDLSLDDEPERGWMMAPYGNFEGALINRSVIDKIGYPDERFFVGGDDMIYGYLASFHTNVLFAREVGFRRALPQAMVWSRMYYYLTPRNRFLTREHLRKRGAPVDNPAFWFSLLRMVLWFLRDAMRGFRPGWKQNAQAVILGLRDGYRGRYGRPPWIRA
jgi:rhamnopyranosyl-N-acetylglucosaminyl-diphospho-decaprenol beta-1,3/1,4-galactofuranosyltransferase